jgi:hypothetical protein
VGKGAWAVVGNGAQALASAARARLRVRRC